MKIINGEENRLGRIASYAAKQALKGEDIAIINCEKIIITGNKRNIQERFYEKRRMGSSSQKGPRISIKKELIVKRAIRGMLPDHRKGRGRTAFKKIKCYVGIPKEFQGKDIENLKTNKAFKSIKIQELK